MSPRTGDVAAIHVVGRTNEGETAEAMAVLQRDHLASHRSKGAGRGHRPRAPRGARRGALEGIPPRTRENASSKLSHLYQLYHYITNKTA